MNKIEISHEVLNILPQIQVVGLKTIIPNTENLLPLILGLEEQANAVFQELNKIDAITSISEISNWREVYSTMGIKPSKFHSSIESLLRRFKKSKDVKINQPIVDFYNLVSILNKVPMGAYDIKKLPELNISIRQSFVENDLFQPLGGKADAFPLNDSLFVYANNNDILCWGLNCRDSELFCIDETTREVIFLSETTELISSASSLNAINQIADSLNGIGIITSKPFIINAENPVYDFYGI